MRIMSSNFCSPNFSGVLEYRNVTEKCVGKPYYNKAFYKIYDFVYHPFKGENIKTIQEEIQKTKKGLSFTMWEKDHGHQEGDYFFLNNVTVGERIRRNDAKKLKSTSDIGIPTPEEIHQTYNNAAYGVMDLRQISMERVSQLIN